MKGYHFEEPFDAERLYGPLWSGWTREQCEQHALAHFAVCCRQLDGPIALVDRPNCGLMTVSKVRAADAVWSYRP